MKILTKIYQQNLDCRMESIEMRFLKGTLDIYMLRKKEKEAFHDFNWVEAFSSCTVFSMSKSLNKRWSIIKRCFRPTKSHF